jgi:hypothetical protein
MATGGKRLPGFFETEKGVHALLTVTAVLWGGNAVAAKYTVGELPLTTTAFLFIPASSFPPSPI